MSVMKLVFHRIYVLLFGIWSAMRSLAKEGRGSVCKNSFRYFRAWAFANVQLHEYCELVRLVRDEASLVAHIEKAIKDVRFKKKWNSEFFANRRFLLKYSSLQYDTSQAKIARRIKAYRKRFDIGEGSYINYGVMIIAEHFSDSNIKIGNNCLLSRNLDLDITGGLTIGNDVCILEGAKIFTHAHDSLHMRNDNCLIPYSNRAYKTPLVIEDNVEICSRAIIMPGVSRIGRNSMISAGSVVSKTVPPNSVVAGNPAKVMFTLESDMKIDTGH